MKRTQIKRALKAEKKIKHGFARPSFYQKMMEEDHFRGDFQRSCIKTINFSPNTHSCTRTLPRAIMQVKVQFFIASSRSMAFFFSSSRGNTFFVFLKKKMLTTHTKKGFCLIIRRMDDMCVCVRVWCACKYPSVGVCFKLLFLMRLNRVINIYSI